MDSERNSLVVGKRRYRLLPLSKIVKADWNYKKEDATLTKKLVANIKRNGQVENVLVRQLKGDRFEMVNGNHRHDALSELGHRNVVVCDLGKISKAAAMRIAIETNETRFESDFVKLSGMVKEMKLEFAEDDLLSTLPYDLRQLSDIEQITTFEWPQGGGGKPKGNGKGANNEAGKVEMVLRFTSRETNILNTFFTRTGKATPEEAIMWAVQQAQ